MNLERWPEIKCLVKEALELPPEERSAYLAGAAADEELRLEAEAILAVPSARADAFDQYRPFPTTPFEIPLRAGERVGSYAIIRPLGRGGMGAVYLAEDTKNDRRVALKILAPGSGRLAREHRVLARLSHPNIATLYDSGTTDAGLRYVAMEYVEGRPITAFSEERCPTVRSRLELFRKVCAAVDYAHRHLVVHRDLKPGNILVTAAGEPKLLDFGIAKLLPPYPADATLTDSDERPLTVAFASPEQLDGERTAIATDIYSLGVLLCLLLTGRLPYKVQSAYDLPWAIRDLEPQKPSDLAVALGQAAAPGGLPPFGLAPSEGHPRRLRKRLEGDLDAIVWRALRKEPEHRYRSAADLSEDIRRHLADEPVSAHKGTRRYRAAKFIRRQRQGLLAAALILFILSASAVTLLRQHQETRREAERAEAVTGFLIGMFKVPSSGPVTGQSVTAREILDHALAELDAAPPESREIRGTLRRSLGKIYLNLGLYTPAELLLVPALTDIAATRPEDRPLIAETLTDLARLDYYHARYAEAEDYGRRALAVTEQLPGNHLPQAADTLSLLGHIAFARGAFPEAERLFRKVLELRTRAYGRQHPAVAGALNDLSCALHEQGRLAEAESRYRQSLAARRQIFGEDHLDVVQSLANLGRLSEDQGRLAAAEALYLRAIALQRESYDPTLALLWQNLSALALSRGDYDKGDRWLDDSLGMGRALFRERHPAIARPQAELGRLAHARRRHREAESLYRASLKELDRALGADHPDRITVANNLAALLAERGRLAEAEAFWRELLRRVAGRKLRPAIRRTIVHNLMMVRRQHRLAQAASLEREEGDISFSSTRYLTLGLSLLDLTESGLPSPPAPRRLPPAAPRASSPPLKTVRFSDDFEDGVVDPTKWEGGGTLAVERFGQFQLLNAATDNAGWVRTLPIGIDPNRPLNVRRRAKLHPANRYFDGAMHVHILGYPEKRFGVSYANYHYTGDGECVTVGFSIYRRDSNSHRHADRKANASPLVPPIWDRWFDEELVYDSQTGEVRYFLDGQLRLAYNVGPLPPNASSISLTFSSWGWYTGHYHYIDSLAVSQ